MSSQHEITPSSSLYDVDDVDDGGGVDSENAAADSIAVTVGQTSNSLSSVPSPIRVDPNPIVATDTDAIAGLRQAAEAVIEPPTKSKRSKKIKRSKEPPFTCGLRDVVKGFNQPPIPIVEELISIDARIAALQEVASNATIRFTADQFALNVQSTIRQLTKHREELVTGMDATPAKKMIVAMHLNFVNLVREVARLNDKGALSPIPEVQAQMMAILERARREIDAERVEHVQTLSRSDSHRSLAHDE